MMSGLLISFFTSFIATLLIIRFKHLHSHLSSDSDMYGPQKFHHRLVPRIGGIAIGMGLIFAVALRVKNIPDSQLEVALFFSALPTFAIGLAEDLTKKISVNKRLLFTLISAVLMVYLLQVKITRLDIPGIDYILTIPIISYLFTIFAVIGLTNAYNIIDGFNGLSSMVGIITLLAIGYIGFIFSDLTIIYPSLVMAGAILGFFIWNYPRGLIFLGDGGAYLIGFWIASLTIMLSYRHPSISPWAALLINGYPIIETLFSIYRRKFHKGRSPSQPDGIHFHTLIYRRILKGGCRDKDLLSANARTAPYLWVLAGTSIAPAILWWQSTLMLIGASTIFIIFYIWIYSRIVKFKTPKWLHYER